MSDRDSAPFRVRVLATLLMALGVYAAIDFVIDNFNGPFHLNVGVFGLVLGPGLLRMREWARAWTVRLFLILLVAIPLLLVFGFATTTGPWPGLLAGYGGLYWGYRSLLDPELCESFSRSDEPAPIGIGVLVLWSLIVLGGIGEHAYANRQAAHHSWRVVESGVISMFDDPDGFQPVQGMHVGQALERFLGEDEGVAWMRAADERHDWLAFDQERLAVYCIAKIYSSKPKLEIWYFDPDTNLNGHEGRGFSSQLELEGVRLDGDRIAIRFRACDLETESSFLRSYGLDPGERYEFFLDLRADGTTETENLSPLRGGTYHRWGD